MAHRHPATVPVGLVLALCAGLALGQARVKTLASFDYEGTNTDTPSSPLVLATDGNYYGTTFRSFLGEGDGSVYRMTREGKLAILHRFPPDSYPATLMQASDGNLYGTTEGNTRGSLGSVFRLGLAAGFRTLHRFNGADGSTPLGGLVQAADGNLYGTTSGLRSFEEEGSVYRVAPDGKLTTLVLLPAKTISGPTGTLLQGDDGRLHGTSAGGSASAYAGTLFSMSLDGRLSVDYDFTGVGTRDPAGGLSGSGTHDWMLGVCELHGTSPLDGGQAVFGFDGTTFTTLLSSRTGPAGDYSQLTLGPDGTTFYGFASVYGADHHSVSTLYSLTTDGEYRELATVQGYVRSAPTFAPDGALLATTTDGGDSGLGSVFQVTGF